MENIKVLKNQDTVVVPIQRWNRMQNEIKSLKKRVNEIEADDFLKDLHNGK
jgi:hypothetical protein